MSHLVVVLILTLIPLDSLHCQMKFLRLGLICKVEAYLVVLCKHSESTLNQPKTNTVMSVAYTDTLRQGCLHLQGTCGRTCELQRT